MPIDESRLLFELIYQRHVLAVLAYCVRRIGFDVAADACSETFLVVWRRLDQIPTEPDTLPYLYGVASKVVANQNRSTGRKKRLERKIAGLGIPTAPDPAAVVARRDRENEVIDAVRRLNPKDREIVMLYAWEEVNRETIANMMGMSRSAIDQRIHRSYKRLAQTLKNSESMSAYQSPLVAEEGGGR